MKDNNNAIKIVGSTAMSALNPETIPYAETVNLLNTLIKSYKEMEINREREKTERERVRKLSETFIAKFEQDTAKYKIAADQSHEQRMNIIRLVGELLKNPNVDTIGVHLCTMLLEMYKNSNTNYVPDETKVFSVDDNRFFKEK